MRAFSLSHFLRGAFSLNLLPFAQCDFTGPFGFGINIKDLFDFDRREMHLAGKGRGGGMGAGAPS